MFGEPSIVSRTGHRLTASRGVRASEMSPDGTVRHEYRDRSDVPSQLLFSAKPRIDNSLTGKQVIPPLRGILIDIEISRLPTMTQTAAIGLWRQYLGALF